MRGFKGGREFVNKKNYSEVRGQEMEEKKEDKVPVLPIYLFI